MGNEQRIAHFFTVGVSQLNQLIYSTNSSINIWQSRFVDILLQTQNIFICHSLLQSIFIYKQLGTMFLGICSALNFFDFKNYSYGRQQQKSRSRQKLKHGQ